MYLPGKGQAHTTTGNGTNCRDTDQDLFEQCQTGVTVKLPAQIARWIHLVGAFVSTTIKS